ncbi:MAG TPA: polymer-forming cytoskeletal protein [Casimicrobiaceae bacterium]|jgi:cytoskeletal protein CcmA (bactofilin family)|nr:polymer-forming cytoskeletal protein [Casimicrobiaceae bacterium]
MLNFNRRDNPADAKDAKSGLKPALYDPPTSHTRGASTGTPPRQQAQAAAATREMPPAPAPTLTDAITPAAPTRAAAAPAGASGETAGSKLFIGVNIKLKGVEISDCDVLVIEGHVEATVRSKAMQIDKPGTLKGTALIDVAEVHGDFSGELTARTRLVVHGTGRVSGKIRYGKLIVAEGGELSGDVKRIDESEEQVMPARAPGRDPRDILGSTNAMGSA